MQEGAHSHGKLTHVLCRCPDLEEGLRVLREVPGPADKLASTAHNSPARGSGHQQGALGAGLWALAPGRAAAQDPPGCPTVFLLGTWGARPHEGKGVSPRTLDLGTYGSCPQL